MAASGRCRAEQDPETSIVEHADRLEIDEHRDAGMLSDRSRQVVVEPADRSEVDVALDRDDDGSADLVEPRVQLHARPGYGDAAPASRCRQGGSSIMVAEPTCVTGPISDPTIATSTSST